MSQISVEQFAQIRSDYDAALAQQVLDESCDHQLRGLTLMASATLALPPGALLDGLPSMYDPAMVDAQKLAKARELGVKLRVQPKDLTAEAAKECKDQRREAALELLDMAKDPRSIAAVAVGATDALTRAFVHEPHSGAPWAKNVCWSRVKQIMTRLEESKDPVVLWTGPYRRFMVDLLTREKAISATMASWPWLKHSLANIVGAYKDFREGSELATSATLTGAVVGTFQIIAIVGQAAGPWVQGGVNIAKTIGGAIAAAGARRAGGGVGARRAAKELVTKLKTGKENLDEAVALRAMMYKAEPSFFKASWHFGKALRAFIRLQAYTESPIAAQTRSAPKPAPAKGPPPPRPDGGSINEIPALRALVLQAVGTGGNEGRRKRLDAAERLGEIATEGPPAAQPARDAIRDAVGKIVYGGTQKRRTEFNDEEQELLDTLQEADPGIGTQDTTVSDYRGILLDDPDDMNRITAAGGLKALASHPKYAQQVKATLEEALTLDGIKDNPPVKAAVEDALGRSTEHAITNDPNAEWNKEVKEFETCDQALACARDLMKFLHHYDKTKAYLFPVLVFLEYILAKSEGWRELWEGGYQGSKPLRDMTAVLKTLGRMDHNLCRHPDKATGMGARFTHKDLCYKGGVGLKDDPGVFKGKSKKGSPDRAGMMERRRERQKFNDGIRDRVSMLREPPVVHLDSGAEQDDQRRFAAAQSLGKMGGRVMAYNQGEALTVLTESAENDPSDRVRTAARQALDQIVHDLPVAQSTDYSELFKHHDPSKGARFARFVAHAGREPDILSVSPTSEPVGVRLQRLGGVKSYVNKDKVELVTEAAKHKNALKGSADFRYACHVFDGHWTHTFKDPEEAPAKHRLALLLNHIYTRVENRASRQSAIARGAYKLRRWAKDVRWRKVVIGIAVVGATVAVIAVSAATMGTATPLMLAGSAVALGTLISVGGTVGVTLGNVVATGVSTAANAALQSADVDALSKKKGDKGKDEFAFKLSREGEDTFRKAISHFLRARKNMKRLASWNSPTKAGGKLVNPEHDPDRDLKFPKCRHAASYAYAGMRFFHHYEKFARYILPTAWFAKFTLEYINRWDRYWDKMSGKFLARIEETVAKDEAWHNEHCGCAGVDPTTNVASKNKTNTIKATTTKGAKLVSAYCYGQDVAFMDRLEWEPRRPLFPVLFRTRSVTSPEYMFGDKHKNWLSTVRSQWKSTVIDRSAQEQQAPPEQATATPASKPPSKRAMGVLVAMLAEKTYAAPTRANTVDDLFTAIDAADDHFGSNMEAYDPRELRLFLAPEWFFRKPGKGGSGSTPLTHREMRETVDAICTRAKGEKYRNWLILPGTIYFGLDYTTPVLGADGSINPAALADIRTYFKLPASSADTAAVRADQGGVLRKAAQWVVGNVGLAVHRGQVVHYHFKCNQADIAEADKNGDPPAHVWAMNLLDATEAMTVSRSSVFTLSNLVQYEAKKSLTFAYDICRDHRVMMAKYSAQKEGAKPDIQIVICNDVEMQKQSLVPAAGGYVIHCDGLGTEERFACHKVKSPTPVRDLDGLRKHIVRTITIDANSSVGSPKHAKLGSRIVEIDNEIKALVQKAEESGPLRKEIAKKDEDLATKREVIDSTNPDSADYTRLCGERQDMYDERARLAERNEAESKQAPKLKELREQKAALIKEQSTVAEKMKEGKTPEHDKELKDWSDDGGALETDAGDIGKSTAVTFTSGGVDMKLRVWTGRIVIDKAAT